MRIVWISDFDVVGSGYQNLSTELCNGLVRAGHEVKAIGLHYRGQEHNNLFTTIPCHDLKEAVVATYNLRSMWALDVLIVALDVPMQNFFLANIANFRSLFKYIGIMPVEADPLCTSWAMALLQMDLPLIISQFGTDECHKANVAAAKHIPIGVDSQLWRIPSEDEHALYRKGYLNVQDEETFVVLTVADNQERKNLAAALEAYRDFVKEVPNSRYVLVTRENNPVGWSLRDLIFEFGLQAHVILMERGMSQEELWGVYAASDCFLLTSKAEGLGLPLLEAMSTGLPCVATDCTGMRELLADGRGVLIPPMHIHRDPFGNGRRYWIDIPRTTQALSDLYHQRMVPDIQGAIQYVRERTWQKTIDALLEELHTMEDTHEQAPSD